MRCVRISHQGFRVSDHRAGAAHEIAEARVRAARKSPCDPEKNQREDGVAAEGVELHRIAADRRRHDL